MSKKTNDQYLILGGSVLIFVTKKLNSEELAKNMQEKGYQCEMLLLISFMYFGILNL